MQPQSESIVWTQVIPWHFTLPDEHMPLRESVLTDRVEYKHIQYKISAFFSTSPPCHHMSCLFTLLRKQNLSKCAETVKWWTRENKNRGEGSGVRTKHQEISWAKHDPVCFCTMTTQPWVHSIFRLIFLASCSGYFCSSTFFSVHSQHTQHLNKGCWTKAAPRLQCWMKNAKMGRGGGRSEQDLYIYIFFFSTQDFGS